MDFHDDDHPEGPPEPNDEMEDEEETFFSEETTSIDIEDGDISSPEEEEEEGRLVSLFGRWRLYSEMSQLGLVARRFFVKNMTDGILTTLGVVIGFFVAFLADPADLTDTNIIVLPGIGTAVAMCVSGVLASYFVESAERKKAIMELQREMVDIGPVGTTSNHRKHRKKKRTLQERAESFATIVASLIDGFSPFAAALIVLIPFYSPGSPQVVMFIVAIVISLVLLFFLGFYLARLSKVNWLVLGLKMVIMGLLTLLITYALGQL
nr:VIT1/CCC1 transporter family protein [Candidatus Sigynarchaeota archaeon]